MSKVLDGIPGTPGASPPYVFSLATQRSKHWASPLLLQIQASEEGLLYIQSLVRTFRDVCCWWVGPWQPVVRIFHPAFIKPVLLASGRHHAGPSLHTRESQVTSVQSGRTVIGMSLLQLPSNTPNSPVSISCGISAVSIFLVCVIGLHLVLTWVHMTIVSLGSQTIGTCWLLTGTCLRCW